MIPHARFVFNWEAAGGKFFNVVDPMSSVYADGSSINQKTVAGLGLPTVEGAEDEEALIRLTNAAFLGLRAAA